MKPLLWLEELHALFFSSVRHSICMCMVTFTLVILVFCERNVSSSPAPALTPVILFLFAPSSPSCLTIFRELLIFFMLYYTVLYFVFECMIREQHHRGGSCAKRPVRRVRQGCASGALGFSRSSGGEGVLLAHAIEIRTGMI